MSCGWLVFISPSNRRLSMNYLGDGDHQHWHQQHQPQPQHLLRSFEYSAFGSASSTPPPPPPPPPTFGAFPPATQGNGIFAFGSPSLRTASIQGSRPPSVLSGFTDNPSIGIQPTRPYTTQQQQQPQQQPRLNHLPIPPAYKFVHLWDQRWPRQWSWIGVDIPVHGLKSLREKIEHPPSNRISKLDGLQLSNDDPSFDGLDYSAGEVLSCNFGGNDRWKVEVVRGHTRRPSAPTTPTRVTHQPTTIGRTLNGAIRPITPPRFTNRTTEEHKLSLYLTCNEIDWQTSRSISTSILVSIKEPRIPLHSNPITDLGTHHEGWIWRTQADPHTFEKEKEVWECTSFPSLSSLLNNPRVNAFDSFVLSVQIGTPAVFSVPQIPMASFIPHSVLESLESLLDDPNTSDLQIVVTEVSENNAEARSEGSEGGSHQGGTRKTRARFRKRVLYAHSSILKHRSEYFRTMLADEIDGGGWAESGPRPSTSSRPSHSSDHNPPTPSPSVDRKLGLIKIEDFDFVSVYWLLRWLYSNRIFFEEHDDVRAQCNIGGVLSSSESNLMGGTGMRSSKARVRPELKDMWSWQMHPINPFSEENTSQETTEAKQAGSKALDEYDSTPPHKTASTSTLHPSSPDFLPVGVPSSHTDRKDHHSSNWLTGDPHVHPVEMKEKASAFAIYRLSHRYELKTLQDLALTHLISNLLPASAFPMLLASFIFPELHAEVKAYCLANYFEILQQPEFSRCYAEVGEGLWEHGGEVLLSFTMSLRPAPPSLT